METYDPRQDEYIVNAADFAQPILIHLRQLIHDVAPEIQETMKWNIPFFLILKDRFARWLLLNNIALSVFGKGRC